MIEIRALTDGNADSERQVHKDRSNRAEESFLEDAKSEMSLRYQVGAKGQHSMNGIPTGMAGATAHSSSMLLKLQGRKGGKK